MKQQRHYLLVKEDMLYVRFSELCRGHKHGEDEGQGAGGTF